MPVARSARTRSRSSAPGSGEPGLIVGRSVVALGAAAFGVDLWTFEEARWQSREATRTPGPARSRPTCREALSRGRDARPW